MIFGYARVSTNEQNPQLQTDALTTAGCEHIYTDYASGKLTARPQLDRLIEHLRQGDTVIVWRLDRLGRNLTHLLELTRHFDDHQVAFRSLTEQLDTTTPGGRLIFHVFASIAQFERELLSERTKAGLAAAKTRGRTGGRPTVLTPAKTLAANEMLNAGHTIVDIAAALDVSRATLYRRLDRQPTS